MSEESFRPRCVRCGGDEPDAGSVAWVADGEDVMLHAGCMTADELRERSSDIETRMAEREHARRGDRRMG